MPGVATIISVEVLDLLDRAGRLVHGVDPHAVAHVVGRVEEVAVRAQVAAVDAGRGLVGRVGHDALQRAALVDRDGQAGAARAVRGAEDGVGGYAGCRDVVGVGAVRGQRDVVRVSEAQIISDGVSLEVASGGYV